MRAGFLIGFLIAAAVASLLRQERQGALGVASDEGDGVMGKLRRRIEEAKDAGRQASAEKEAELRRGLEDATKGNVDD